MAISISLIGLAIGMGEKKSTKKIAIIHVRIYNGADNTFLYNFFPSS